MQRSRLFSLLVLCAAILSPSAAFPKPPRYEPRFLWEQFAQESADSKTPQHIEPVFDLPDTWLGQLAQAKEPTPAKEPAANKFKLVPVPADPKAPATAKHARGYVKPKNLDAMMKASFARHGRRLKLLQAVPLPAQYETPYQIPQQNQGDCGDCWCVSGCIVCSNAFVAAGQAKSDGSFVIAPDAVLWCNSTGGCNGDDFSTVFNICQSTGLPIQSCFGAYQDTDRGTCNKSCPTFQITNWGYVNTDTSTPATYSQIKSAIFEWGSVGLTVDASGFDNYTSGVMTYKGRGTDHQIIATGWNDNYSDSSYTGQALHIKNQWGDWGETNGPNNEPGYGWLAVFSDGTIAASGSSEVAWAEVGTGPAPPVTPVTPNFNDGGAMPAGTIGTPYSYQVSATGTPAPTFSVSSGTLPAWANMANGLISGTPTASGSSAFSVTATNTAGTATENLTLTVSSPIPPSPPGPPAPPTPGAPVAYMTISTLSGSALLVDASQSENVSTYEFYYSPSPAFSMVGNGGSKVLLLPSPTATYQTVVLVGWASDGITHNISTQTISLTPQPVVPTPPAPTPNPPVPPTPAPTPAKGFRVMMVYDAANVYSLSAGQREILFSTAKGSVRDYLASHCTRDSSNNPDFRILDQGQPDSIKNDTEVWQAFWKLPRKSLPWIVVSNGVSGVEGPMPQDSAICLQLLRKYGGD